MKKLVFTSILIIFFLSSVQGIFAQTNAVQRQRLNDSTRLAVISSTLTLGIASQVAGLALLTFGATYYGETVSPNLTRSNNQALSNQERNDAFAAWQQSRDNYIQYLSWGTALFVLGTASSTAGIIVALVNLPQQQKRTQVAQFAPYLSKRGSLQLSATSNSDFHLFSNGFYIEVFY